MRGGSLSPPHAVGNLPSTITSLYSILRVAGRGDQSIIYKAVRTADGETCALKCVQRTSASKRENEEVSFLQSLEHPNIVKHRNVFADERDLYIELDWADGGDLKALLQRHAGAELYMSEARVLDFFIQIARAVRHMHERRILHRDLKPANCLLLKDGTVKIADFGLGRQLEKDQGMAHSRVGTPLYMAPEILLSQAYDYSSDVWSMGCVLYELCTLTSPFKSPTAQENDLVHVVKRITTDEYPPISDKLPYSQQTRDLVRAMLQRDPAKRPAAATVCTVVESRLLSLQRPDKAADRSPPVLFPSPPLGERTDDASPSDKCRRRKYYSAVPSPRSSRIHSPAAGAVAPSSRAPHPPSMPPRLRSLRSMGSLSQPESPLSPGDTPMPLHEGDDLAVDDKKTINEGARTRAPALHTLSIATTKDALSSSAASASASASAAAPVPSAVNPFATRKDASALIFSPKSSLLPDTKSRTLLFSPRSATRLDSPQLSRGGGSPHQFSLWANAAKQREQSPPQSANSLPTPTTASNSPASQTNNNTSPPSATTVSLSAPSKSAPAGALAVVATPALVAAVTTTTAKGYRLGDMLGEGSYARVYLAVDVRSGSLFAVKQMLVNELDNLAQMEKEISVLKELNHPNLVRYLGTERGEAGTLNVMLEYCNGGSIAQMLRQFHSFPEGLIRLYTRHMVDALRYLHERGFVHRDIKGGNVLVNGHEARGVAKLSDFGCTQRLLGNGANKDNKSISKINGTVLWMAPESARQDPRAGPPADVWSLGATVIEMATGRPPWTEEGLVDSIPALIKIATTTKPPAFPANLSAVGVDFLSKCLVVDYAKRWTCEQLRDHDFVNQIDQRGGIEPITPRTPSFALEAAAKGRNKQEERDAALLLVTRQCIQRCMHLLTGIEDSKWSEVFAKDVELSLPKLDVEVGVGFPQANASPLKGLGEVVANFQRIAAEPRRFRVESTKNTNELMDHSSKTGMWRWEIGGVVLESAKRFKVTGTASASFEQGFDHRERGGAAFCRVVELEVLWDVKQCVNALAAE